MTLYERINEVREQRGIAWSHINKSINAYRGKMTEFKNGKTTLTNEEVRQIAKDLNVSFDYLLGTSDKKEPTPASESGLTEKDIRLLDWFHSLPTEKRQAILTVGDGPKDLCD